MSQLPLANTSSAGPVLGYLPAEELPRKRLRAARWLMVYGGVLLALGLGWGGLVLFILLKRGISPPGMTPAGVSTYHFGLLINILALVIPSIAVGVVHWLCGRNAAKGHNAGLVASLVLLPLEGFFALLCILGSSTEWTRMRRLQWFLVGVDAGSLTLVVVMVVLMIWVIRALMAPVRK